MPFLQIFPSPSLPLSIANWSRWPLHLLCKARHTITSNKAKFICYFKPFFTDLEMGNFTPLLCIYSSFLHFFKKKQ